MSHLVIECVSDVPPLLPEGDQYVVSFKKAERKTLWGNQQKLFLHFEIVEPAVYAGLAPFMALTLRKRLGISTKLWRTWTLAAGTRPKRRDRFDTRVFEKKLFRVRLRTVKKDSRQNSLNADQQYSVVDELIELVAGARLNEGDTA